MSDNLLNALHQSINFVEEVLDGVSDEQRGAPTPCPEFTVNALVAHLISATTWYGEMPEEPTIDPIDIKDPDLMDTRLTTAFRQAADIVYRTWTPETLRKTFDTPFGPTTGAQMTAYMVIELLGHGWDLAVATKQSIRPDADLAEHALVLATAMGEDGLRAPKMMGPAVPVAIEASAVDQLVGFIGRNPAFVPVA